MSMTYEIKGEDRKDLIIFFKSNAFICQRFFNFYRGALNKLFVIASALKGD